MIKQESLDPYQEDDNKEDDHNQEDLEEDHEEDTNSLAEEASDSEVTNTIPTTMVKVICIA
jgi:hypothetical protein